MKSDASADPRVAGRAWLVPIALAACFAVLSCSRPAPRRSVLPEPSDHLAANVRFEQLSAAYLDWYLETNPIRATQLGVHRHDWRMPDMSHAGLRRRSERQREWLNRLLAIERADLSGDPYLDHRVLEYAIRADLLDLDEIASWRRNPMLYHRLIADALASLVDREFAPLADRMRSMNARMRAVPRLLEAAKQNLTQVPHLWAELALSGARGTARFLREDVPTAVAQQGLDEVDPRLHKRWRRLLGSTTLRVERFADWIERDLFPRANHDFRLGKEMFERKLLYEEHVSLSAERLAAMNQDAIAGYLEWAEREAARIDPGLPLAEVMRRIAEDHPSPDRLIPTAREFVLQAQELVRERQLVSLPSDHLPIVRPTPEYARSGFASMSTPGPFEDTATEAYFNITNVDPDWSEEQSEQHLTYFNYSGLLGIGVHEVMPGHFVQFLFRRRMATPVRKVFIPDTFVEGWAHYVEQMMVDEGLGQHAPRVRLGQLRRALQRHARWQASLDMHVSGESVEAATARFAEISFFDRFPALRETQRGSFDPTYLSYALGRMQILELREDYRRQIEASGRTFSLREFHDQLLELGLPLPLAREIMLSAESNGR